MDEKENTRELIVVDGKRYKKLKKALIESEERYRQLFENVPIGIYRTTPDGRILNANPALVAMLGFTSFAELATKNVGKDFWAASYSRSAFFLQLERDGEIKGLESLWVKKDGTPIYVRENAKLTRSEDGQVLFEGTVEDITLSKLAEDAQKTRTKQLEMLNRLICSGNQADSLSELLDTILDQVTKLLGFEMAAIYLFAKDSQHMTIKAHKGVSKGFLRQAISISSADYPFSQVLTSRQSLFADHLSAAQPQLAKKWQWRAAACVPLVSKGLIIGTLNLASCQRAFFTDPEKEIMDLIGKEAGTLISKLQTEVALRESEQYYRLLIDTSPDLIAVTDLNANVQMVNQRFVSRSGYFLNEIIGKSSLNFLAESDQVLLKKNLKKFLKTKILPFTAYSFKKKNGDFIPVELSAALLLDAHGKPKGMIAYGRDISERKLAESKLLAYQEQLRALTSEMTLIEEKERRRIASALHDRIGQNLALCKIKVAAVKTNTAAAAVEVELNEIHRLLEQSIHDARTLICELSPPVLYELGFPDALEWLAERSQEQFHIPVEFSSKDFRNDLNIDQKVLLFQIVREMLINVGKHSQAARAWVILAAAKSFVTVEVKDNGIGFEVPQFLNQKNHGDAFGFFSVRERLNFLGGGMEIRSKPGHGTHIIISVPQKKKHELPNRKD
jgi:PAS domain S-box-containing protein